MELSENLEDVFITITVNEGQEFRVGAVNVGGDQPIDLSAAVEEMTDRHRTDDQYKDQEALQWRRRTGGHSGLLNTSESRVYESGWLICDCVW